MTSRNKNGRYSVGTLYGRLVTEKMVRIKTVWLDRFWMKKWSGWTSIYQLNMVQPDQFWLLKVVRPDQNWSGVMTTLKSYNMGVYSN